MNRQTNRISSSMKYTSSTSIRMYMICCYLSMIIIQQGTQHCQGFTFVTPSNKSTYSSSLPSLLQHVPSKLTFIIPQQSTQYHSFSSSITSSTTTTTTTQIYLRAPPGSGYLSDEDETSFYPSTYEPMMEYPGSMRPGKTPENQPYSSLPIQESDPDPVPWPHFQEIEWHHNWGSPHEHPIPMEEFIDMHGRWATAEMEAEMRAGARRGVRERRELEEAQKAASFILDDDDDDDEDDTSVGTTLELGEGVDALIGAGAAVEKTISSVKTTQGSKQRSLGDGNDEEEDGSYEDDDEDDDGDNFLLDLGLDETIDEEEDGDDEGDDDEEPAFAMDNDGTDGILEAMQSMIDAEDDGDNVDDGDDNEIDIDFDDLGLSFEDDDDDDDDDDDSDNDGDIDNNFVVMDDDDISMESDDMTLDEMIGNEDMGADDDFDDGGFDYD